MTPVLGIIASSNQQGRASGPVGSYDSLATVIVPSGGLASITFAGIPTGYQHLQIRSLVRNTSTSNGYNARFNGDSGSNYARHYLITSGSSVIAAASASTTSAILNDAAISTSGTGVFGVSVCDILEYRSTKNKTIRTLGGFNNSGSGSVGFLSGLYLSTSAITNILITPDAGNFAEFSRFTLYGVK